MRELIDDLFPHRRGDGKPAYRRHQFEVIRDTLSAFDDGVDDVIVEAPTGAGKTSVAVTVARVMTRGFGEARRRARALIDDGGDVDGAMEIMAHDQAHLITSRKMLQDAYLGDDPTIVLVKGKSNYECHRRPEDFEGHFSCEDGEHIHGQLCPAHDCPYRRVREDALWSPIALHNFEGFLYQVTMGGVFAPRGLLTIDEAHGCEDRIRNFLTIDLDESLFKSLGLEWARVPDVDDMSAVDAWAMGLLAGVCERIESLRGDLASDRRHIRTNADIRRVARAMRVIRRLELMQEKLDRFHNSRLLRRPATWVASVDGGRVSLEPVDAARFVPWSLFRFGERRLHLSATFLNARGAYTRSVNLKMSRIRHITVPSGFEAERRPLILRSAGRLGQVSWAQNFPRVVQRLREILRENRGIRGVIHCTSYDMGREIKRAMGREKRLLDYDQETREAIVGDFVAGFSVEDAVLLAVSMTEGFDFKYDLCRFQVLVRVPYLVPTRCVEARKKLDPRFYGWRTALTLVQTYGRGMRSADDWCRTYVLDERFTDFVDREGDQLPGWFTEAIR